MRTPRIFSPLPLQSDTRVELDGNACRHLLQVLRLPPGAPLILFDGSGRDFDARLAIHERRRCSADVGKILRAEQAPALKIHLAIGVSRGERMDYAIQKAVELGVWSLTPLFTERTVVRLQGRRLATREEHWTGVIRHACEQSGRSLLPTLHPAIPLPRWLDTFGGRGLLLDHRVERGLRALSPARDDITLLVGPEGGLSDQEREAAARKGMEAVRLGPRVLRTETAPLAAIAAIQALWGDFD